MRCAHCGLENPPGMRFCGGCGGALAGAARRLLPGPRGMAHRRHMTVMFCDIVESTPLAEKLDPEDFREILSGYQHACARAIERFNGYTAQYAGDGLIAYFGYPRAHEDSAQRAVHSGLGILEELAALNSELEGLYGIALRVRIGIHSGVVVADRRRDAAHRPASGVDRPPRDRPDQRRHPGSRRRLFRDRVRGREGAQGRVASGARAPGEAPERCGRPS
jgi:hypothetical protein